jgi:N utilization substance protein B
MNARHAARELALLTLFQLDARPEDGKALEKSNLKDLILLAIRALVAQAEQQIQNSAESLAEVSRHLIELEQEHPSNLATPIDAPIHPVPIPTTREMVEKIETCLQAAEWVHEALRIPLLSALGRREDVQNYTIRLVRLVKQHQKEFESLISELSAEWRVERLAKMDLTLLLLAACEMKYVADVDPGVAINEAVELAKQFSSEDSHRFINGILGAMAERIEPVAEGSPQEDATPEDLSHV